MPALGALRFHARLLGATQERLVPFVFSENALTFHYGLKAPQHALEGLTVPLPYLHAYLTNLPCSNSRLTPSNYCGTADKPWIWLPSEPNRGESHG